MQICYNMKIIILADFVPKQNLSYSDEFIDLMFNADLIIFNLEGSPLMNSTIDISNQIMSFTLEELDNFLIRFGKEKFLIALANNHILDNGLSGLDHLIEYLVYQKINFFGTKEIPYFQSNNIGIINFVTAETVADYSVGKQKLNYLFYDGTNINSQIKELESKANYLLMYPHWGRDMDTQIFKTYNKIIKTNKKWLIFGHHPHVISGLNSKGVYSLGNTFIPHPYYYTKYPATRFGLIVILETEHFDYSLKLSNVVQYGENFRININEYKDTPKEVVKHGSKFSIIKRIYLKIFEFKGNSFDKLKLYALQGMRTLFRLKYKFMNSNTK